MNWVIGCGLEEEGVMRWVERTSPRKTALGAIHPLHHFYQDYQFDECTTHLRISTKIGIDETNTRRGEKRAFRVFWAKMIRSEEEILWSCLNYGFWSDGSQKWDGGGRHWEIDKEEFKFDLVALDRGFRILNSVKYMRRWIWTLGGTEKIARECSGPEEGHLKSLTSFWFFSACLMLTRFLRPANQFQIALLLVWIGWYRSEGDGRTAM